MPRSAKRSRVSSCTSASSIAAFSLATRSFEVSFGAHSPYQSEAWNPGNPASAVVGMSPAAVLRFVDVMANGLIAPALA
jgi:hypothetical protein